MVQLYAHILMLHTQLVLRLICHRELPVWCGFGVGDQVFCRLQDVALSWNFKPTLG